MSKIMSTYRRNRDAAKAAGEQHYHGQICARCKETSRYTGNGCCVKCALASSARCKKGKNYQGQELGKYCKDNAPIREKDFRARTLKDWPAVCFATDNIEPNDSHGRYCALATDTGASGSSLEW